MALRPRPPSVVGLTRSLRLASSIPVFPISRICEVCQLRQPPGIVKEPEEIRALLRRIDSGTSVGVVHPAAVRLYILGQRVPFLAVAAEDV